MTDFAFPRCARIQVNAHGQETYSLGGESRNVGGQLVFNGEFSMSISGWGLFGNPTADLGIDLAPDWSLRERHTASVRDTDAASLEAMLGYAGESDDVLIPVKPGRAYRLADS